MRRHNIPGDRAIAYQAHICPPSLAHWRNVTGLGFLLSLFDEGGLLGRQEYSFLFFYVLSLVPPMVFALSSVVYDNTSVGIVAIVTLLAVEVISL